MQLYPLKLVTVVGETVIMDDIAQEAVKLGATGYTLSEVVGQGSRSARNVILTGAAKTMKLEFVVSMDVAEKILMHVSHNYFEHYACIAWLSDVQVVRGLQYTQH
jgi:nitrogen regulatory protein P-II 2